MLLNDSDPLKIYLADLTYDTVTISSEVFPLNVAYIASYCKSKFGDNVDITLFKYIDDLEKKIYDSPPDVLGISNYIWCQNIGLEMFRIFKQKNPSGITVWGGPNFPIDYPSQIKFLEKYSDVDVYVQFEGEYGLANIIDRIFSDSSQESLELIHSNSITGCISRDHDDNLVFGEPVIRMRNLNEIPSPYLTGILDKFFDGRINPLIQTNRGCPFTCTFCTDGNDEVMKVNNFTIDRVNEELEYIAKHVPKNTHGLYISDLNFGMFKRDLDICDKIHEIQTESHYPHYIECTTGKNSKDKIIKAIERLEGSMNVTMSVQSLDPEVLQNVRRDNISVEQMLALKPAIHKAGLKTISEVILGLPGDSFEKHLETIRQLIRVGTDRVLVYSCMMLNGSEMNIPQERKKWEFKTKYRILPRDFVKLCNGKKILEIDEIAISSNTLNFEDYVNLRLFAFIMWSTHNNQYYPIIKFLLENDVEVFDLFYQMYLQKEHAPERIQNLFNKVKESTINELWDSPESIIKFFQDDKNYEKLLKEEIGFNVIQYYHVFVVDSHSDDFREYMCDIAFNLLKEKQVKPNIFSQFEDVKNYLNGISKNILEENQNNVLPSFVFSFDVYSWLKSNSTSKLDDYKLSSKTTMIFKSSKQQADLLNDMYNTYGHTGQGKSQILKHLGLDSILRIPYFI